MWCFPQFCSDKTQKIHWARVSLQKPVLAVYVCRGWIRDHVSSRKAKCRNTRCHFWTLWPKTLKVYTLPAGNCSAVVCLANKPWKSPDLIHQVFTPACTRNVSVAFPDPNTCGLSWRPHLKSLMFPKEQRFDYWYKFSASARGMW